MHHLLMVAGSFPNCSASHLFVRLRSANTILMRFKSLLFIETVILLRVVNIAIK